MSPAIDLFCTRGATAIPTRVQRAANRLYQEHVLLVACRCLPLAWHMARYVVPTHHMRTQSYVEQPISPTCGGCALIIIWPIYSRSTAEGVQTKNETKSLGTIGNSWRTSMHTHLQLREESGCRSYPVQGCRGKCNFGKKKGSCQKRSSMHKCIFFVLGGAGLSGSV